MGSTSDFREGTKDEMDGTLTWLEDELDTLQHCLAEIEGGGK